VNCDAIPHLKVGDICADCSNFASSLVARNDLAFTSAIATDNA
jgi:hypothetical protein